MQKIRFALYNPCGLLAERHCLEALTRWEAKILVIKKDCKLLRDGY